MRLAPRLLALPFAVGVLVAGSALPAQAATTVGGEVSCINSAAPVGVWVEAKSSRSGWATVTPLKPARAGMKALSTASYSFSLNKGGQYQVHVGCGGTKVKWKVSAKSGYVSGTRNNFRCNDADPIASFLLKRLTPWKFNLSQGIAYKTCKKV